MIAWPIVSAERADWFLEQLDTYTESVSSRQPDFQALRLILEECGRSLLLHLEQCLYPDRVVFIPHRRLHQIPWHACFAPGPGGAPHFVGDFVSDVCYASSVFELLWANWWPASDEDNRKETPPRLLAVADLGATDLRWVALEHQFLSAKREMGWPIDIIVDAASLPDSFGQYLRITWSSHATSASNGWARSGLIFGARTIAAETIMKDWLLRRQPTVMLGACETALDLAAPRDSDEYCGIDLAFRVAGAGAVASTMWSIADPVAALGNLSIEQYELSAERFSPSRAVTEFQKSLRTGDWHWYLATEEQIERGMKPSPARDKMASVVRELRKLDPRELQDMKHWACWRCVSA